MKRDRLGGVILGEGRKFTDADRLAVAELAREDHVNAEAYVYYEAGIIWCPCALGHAGLVRAPAGYGYFDPVFWEQDAQGRLIQGRCGTLGA